LREHARFDRRTTLWTRHVSVDPGLFVGLDVLYLEIAPVGHDRDTTIDAFEADWRKRWLVERGVEIISEAGRRLTDELKSRRPEIPWSKVAGIGNVLRHEYAGVSAPVMWKVENFFHPLALHIHPSRPTMSALAHRSRSTASTFSSIKVTGRQQRQVGDRQDRFNAEKRHRVFETPI
jgi:uncharacterized protein with HEPN domain